VIIVRVLNHLMSLLVIMFIERDSVNAWLSQDISVRKISQLVALNPDTVVCDCISDRVRHLLKDFNRRKEIHLFFEIYKNKLQKQSLRNLEKVVDIYQESVKEYEKYVQQLATGRRLCCKLCLHMQVFIILNLKLRVVSHCKTVQGGNFRYLSIIEKNLLLSVIF